MVVRKALNNNMISAYDDAGNEVVAVGRGIGFSLKTGDYVDENEVTKIFYSVGSSQEKRMLEILRDIPIDCILMTDKIVEYASSVLKIKLNPSLLITLADHINYAMQRVEKNLVIESPIGEEIRYIYPTEYGISQKAINYIARKSGTHLPSEELKFLTIHFVNAQTEYSDIPDTKKLGKIIKEVNELIQTEFDLEIDVTSITYCRFISHLRCFLIRQLSGSPHYTEDMHDLYLIIQEKYPSVINCVKKVSAFLQDNYQMTFDENEEFYLALHIERLKLQVNGELL